MKKIKVKITYPYQFEDFVEYIDVEVPIGCNEEEKIIQNAVDKYEFLYGY